MANFVGGGEYFYIGFELSSDFKLLQKTPIEYDVDDNVEVKMEEDVEVK